MEEGYNEDNVQHLIHKYEENPYHFFDADEYETIALYYFEHQDYDFAKNVIENGLSVYKKNFDLLLLKAEVCTQNEEVSIAKEVLEQATVLFPYRHEGFLALGNLLSQMENFEGAINAYEEVIHLDKNNGDVFLEIAFQFINLKAMKKAIKYLKNYLNFYPEDDTALLELGIAYGEVDPELGVKFFTSYIDSYPYSTIAWFNLGNAYYRLEDYKNALTAFDYGIVTNEHFSANYYGKANAYIQLDKYKKAILTFKETFAFEQPHAFVYCHIGECYEKLADYKKALVFYEKSLELDDHQSDAWMGIGVVKDLMHQSFDGLKFMERALKNDPDNVDFVYLYAELLAKVGRVEEANVMYKKVVEMDPDNVDAWLDYSSVLFENEKNDEAVNVIFEGLTKTNNESELQFRLVAYLIENDKIDLAKSILRSALKKDSKGYRSLYEFYPKAQQIQEIVNIIAREKK